MICEHGSLKRSCVHCETIELYQDIKQLEQERDTYKEALNFIAESTMSMLGTNETAVAILRERARKALKSFNKT